jgi:putative membrane protein
MSRFIPALIVFNVTIVLVHWPAIVDLTLRSGWAHFIAHAVLLLSAFIVWMPIVSPLPEIPRLVAPLRMTFLFLQSVVPTIPASFLTFGSRPLYRRYESLPKLWGISALDDQLIAGLIMKIGAGLLLWALIAVIFFRWAAAEERRNRPGPGLRDLDRELTEMGLRA